MFFSRQYSSQVLETTIPSPGLSRKILCGRFRERVGLQKCQGPKYFPGRGGGFSLIEMLAVLVLIGLAAGIVAVNVRSYMIRGKQNAARGEIATLVSSLEAYYLAYSRFPSNDEGLDILTETSDEIPEPLMDRVPIDPWGHRYQYNQPGSNGQVYEVFSYGADGREGGEAADKDIRNDDQRKENL